MKHDRIRPEFLPLNHEVRSDDQQTALGLTQWPDDPFDVPPSGDFFTQCPGVLMQVRLKLLEQNRCPRLMWRGLDVPMRLIYQKTREEGGGRLCLRLRCAEYEHLKRATERLTGSDSYADEPLGSWMCKTVRCLLKGHRHYIPKAHREAIVARQGYKCARCGADFTADVPPEIDHKNPVSTATNHESELWALCGECHHEKTLDDKSKRVLTESHLSDSVWQALVETPPQGGLVLKLGNAPDRACRYLDKRRCRTSILQNSDGDWPIFLPHDEIKPYIGGGFGDFAYVDAPTPSTFEEMWSLAPLRGPGWYHSSAVKTAVGLGKIELSQVRWVLRASLHIKADRMSSIITEALSPFDDRDVRLGDGSEMNLRKEACNRMIGLWGRRTQTTVYATCTRTAGDEAILASCGSTYRRPVPGADGWWDIIHEVPRISRHTRYPWYRMVIDQEAALLCRMAFAVEQLPGRIYEVNVDSILCERTRGLALRADREAPSGGHAERLPARGARAGSFRGMGRFG